MEYVVEGSPYFIDSFTKGSVQTQNGNFSEIEMRYNIFFDQVEFKENDSVYAIGPDPIISKVTLGDKTLVIDQFELRGKVQTSYFVRLDSGKLTLMAKPIVTFKDREEPKPMQDATPAKYTRMPDVYYFKVRDGSLIKVGSIKSMIENLPDKKKKWKSLLRKKKYHQEMSKSLKPLFDTTIHFKNKFRVCERENYSALINSYS